MQVELSQQGDRLIARPRGRMEAVDGDEFAAAIDERLDPTVKGVTIDLAELEFVGLGAIRAMLRLARSLKCDGRDLDFLAGSAAVRHALEQAGMADFFPFTPAIHSHRGHHHEAS